MKISTLLTLLLVGAAGALIVRRLNENAQASAPSDTSAHSPYVPIVEKVLHQHGSEDTPMVHAFEAALEEERRHEEQLAHDAGVPA